jgi:TetR/AcrR family transcriptional regulator
VTPRHDRGSNCRVAVSTKQLVNKRSARQVPAGRQPDGSRARLIAAAAAEFAAHGFAGANVERIAAAAHVNKAMIYYHFRSKAALYRVILRDMFQAVGARARAAAESRVTPEEKIALFVDAIAAEAEARPHFPPIWFREIAEGGSHLDAAIVRDLTLVLQSLGAIVDEGARAGRFRRVNPLVVHAGIVAPMMMYFASARLRERLERAGVKGAAMFDRAQLVDHLRRVALGVLEGRI